MNASLDQATEFAQELADKMGSPQTVTFDKDARMYLIGDRTWFAPVLPKNLTLIATLAPAPKKET